MNNQGKSLNSVSLLVNVDKTDVNGEIDTPDPYSISFYKSSPVVYILTDKKTVYIGETVNLQRRFTEHNKNTDKKKLKNRYVIFSESFNKSVTLHLESFLIAGFSASGDYQVNNSNLGNSSHHYYKKQVYESCFPSIWAKLLKNDIVKISYKSLVNSNVFKFTPYKSLLPEQQNVILQILETWMEGDKKGIFVQGNAGTGKTVIAIYLIKLLITPMKYFEDSNLSDEFSIRLRSLLKEFRKKFHIEENDRVVLENKIAIVVAMVPFRETLKDVFRNIFGLSSDMVISPSQVSEHRYSFLIVDESHRLRQRVNIVNMGGFQKTNEKLGFDIKEGNELDWILKQSDHQLFFYDAQQSVKKSDIPSVHFEKLFSSTSYEVINLKTQIRSLGGNLFTDFINQLFDISLDKTDVFKSEVFDFKLYSDVSKMYQHLKKLEDEVGLCRLVAGYSWKWVSKKNKGVKDIQIGKFGLPWNNFNYKNWINSPNAIKEVGCIHTVQGYDLNYIGIIFGKEIDYDPLSKKIIIYKDQYFDINGKKSTNDADLESYIKNIYKTLIFRGIKGVFIYCCNKELEKYFKKHIDIE